MKKQCRKKVLSLILITGLVLVSSESWTQSKSSTEKAPHDAVLDAQTPREAPVKRPEQQKTGHDQSDIFSATKASPSSSVFADQPEQGKVTGFDFFRDPLNSKKPMMTFEEIYKADVAEKQKVMDMQRQLLEKRYNLTPKLSSNVKMTRGKPVAVGPTARLQGGMTWNKIADMTPEDIRAGNAFPYPPLPHPKQVAGGQVFPQMQIDMFPRLQRFDVDFDIPDPFLPEFPDRK